jgi:two-component system chemotaxis sensor kinase CheA
MPRDPHKYFRIEARDLLTQFGSAVLELEKNGNRDGRVQHLVRLAHTLKGAARVVKEPNIADRAHAIEEFLIPFRELSGNVPRKCVEAVLECVDEIDRRVRALTSTPEGTPAVQSPSVPEDDIRTVQTNLVDMDLVLGGLTETHALLNALRAAQPALEQAERLTALLLDQTSPNDARPGHRNALVNAQAAHATVQELRKHLHDVRSDVGLTIEQIDRELNQVRDAAEQLRLVSAASLFEPLERTVRDTARTLGKKVSFEGTGSDIRLEAHVLGRVQRALVQTVRNAVAHGIESEDERRVANKPVVGHVLLRVARHGKQVVFTCRDDGRGVDFNAVQRVAAQRGLLSPETRSHSAEDLLRLLMQGGISTTDTVTEVSGRGIGLDVVRESVEQLGGHVNIRNEPGQGVTFEFVVPISMASLDVLVVGASGNTVLIPMDAVRAAIRVKPDEISWARMGDQCSTSTRQFHLFRYRALYLESDHRRDELGLRW